MNNFNLVAEPPLGFNQKKFKNLILFEELEYSLISVSLSDNHYTLFKKNIFNSFKLDLPKVGSTKISTVDNTKIIALQPNQYFFMYEFILMSPRSSSHSFYHILTQSAQNIL